MTPIKPSSLRRTRRRALAILRRRLASFRAEERGSLTVFAAFLIVILLIVGGMAVDVLRYEYQRVRLQTTADRAVLAAGSLRQPLNPYDVVAEYFDREGLLDYLQGVEVQEGLNFRVVSVQTSAIVPAFFMRLVGVNSLNARAVSTAEERFTNVEVSLVLDLSNSMNSFSRIQNLRVAGAEFIDTLFQNAEDGQISVNVVNYTGQVNPGAQLLSYYNVSRSQPFSHCVEFDPAHYQTMALTPGTELTGTGHFDPWHTSRARQMIFCPVPQFASVNPAHDSGRENIVMSGDPDRLRSFLAGLWADGNTSIEIGLKWGAALLDPSTRPIVDDMILRGEVDPVFEGRPNDHGAEDVLKVVVLMTDGENFVQWQLRDQFKTGQSPIWHTVLFSQAPAAMGQPSLQDEVAGLLSGAITPTALQRQRFNAVAWPTTRPSRNPANTHEGRIYLAHQTGTAAQMEAGQGNFYLPSATVANPGNSNVWRDSPWTTSASLPHGLGSAAPGSCTFHAASSLGNPLEFDFWRCPDRIAYRMTWPWLFDNFSLRWVGQRLYIPAGQETAVNTFVETMTTRRPANLKNQHLELMCDTIKARNIPIFTVAFEAPPGGVAAMQSCASSLNHFYDVNGTDISVAFRAIAGTINRLRLTQ